MAIAGLGAVGGADVQAMIDALLQFDRLQALEIADRVYRGGSDMAVFARACMQHTRDRLVSGGNTAALSRIMDELMEAENRMAFSPRPRILMDAALVRLCTPELEQGDAALIARIEALEEQVRRLQERPAAATQAPWAPIPEEQIPPPIPPEEEIPFPIADPTPRAKAPARPKEKPAALKPAATAPRTDEKNIIKTLYETMRAVDVGVSQSLHMARHASIQGDTLMVTFAPGDEIFMGALQKYMPQLTKAAQDMFGCEKCVMKTVNPDEDEMNELARKAQALLGIKVDVI